MQKNKKQKEYTKQDSIAFKAYKENIREYGSQVHDWVDDEFKIEYAKFEDTSTYIPKGRGRLKYAK